MAEHRSVEELLEDIDHLKDYFEKQFELNQLKFEEKELELEEIILNKEEENCELKKNCQLYSLEIDRYLKTIEDLTETLNKERRRVVHLEVQNEELESKARSAEASLESMRYDLEKAQEELIIYKTESDFTQSTKIGGDSPEPKTLHHIEVQTEGSFISPPPQHASSPQKSIQIDKGLPHRLSQATVGSPTVNIIKNLILSPAEIGNSFPTSAFKSKDSLKNNVFSREFSILGSKSSFHEPKRTTPGSPTPLKAFLNDHMEKLKRCREAACAVDLNKQYCITGGKGSQKASLTNSNNHSITNLRKSDSNTAKTLYQELIETKSRPSKSRSLKRTSPRIDGSVPKSKVTPTSCLKHDEFSKQFFGKNTKNYRSSVELPGETFTTKLGSIIQERDIFKRRTVAYPEKEVFAYGKEIFENFKMRLNKKPSFVKG